MSLIKRDYSNLKRYDTEDQPLKNRKKWMLAYNEWGKKFKKMLILYLNIIYQRLKYPHLFIKWVLQV